MSKVYGKIFGQDAILEQHPVQYIGRAIDDFLISEYPDSVLRSLIQLSIGFEIYIKKELEKINPMLIHSTFKNGDIYNQLDKLKTLPLRKRYITNNMSNMKQFKNGKTIEFGNAIKLFASYIKIPNRIYEDLKELKEIRNSVFHWESKFSTFNYSKQFIRLIEWIYKYTQKKDGHYLSPEIIMMDPMYEKIEKIRDLKKLLKNENAFNVQKRLYKSAKKYQDYYYIKARVDKDVILEPDKFINLRCPTGNCPSARIALYKDMFKCEICSFAVSSKEYDDYAKYIGSKMKFSDL